MPASPHPRARSREDGRAPRKECPMSLDLSIQSFSERYSRGDVDPHDAKCLPLGPRTAVQEAVLQAFPGTDWRDPVWGQWESEFGSVKFNLGDEEPVDSMMLHVRAGQEVVGAIVKLCLDNGWQ